MRTHARLPQQKWWREYAGEHYYGTISGLVREAVENTVDDEWILQNDSSVSVEQGDLGIDEIKNEMETLNAKIDDLITTWNVDRRQWAVPRRTREAVHQVRGSVPVVRDEEHFRAIRDLMMDHRDPLDVEKDGTVGTITDYFGRDKYEVWQALEYLESVGSARVRSVVIESLRHWYRKDPDAEMRSKLEDYLKSEEWNLKHE